jgi:lysophospholipase L1-like esterase
MTDEAATARVVRFLRMVAVSIAVTSALLCAFALVYTLFLKAPDLDDPFAQAHLAANVRYELLWLAISAAAVALALLTRSLAWAYAPLCLIGIEAGSHVVHWLVAGGRYHPLPPEIRDRFEPHPLTVGRPRPGVYGPFTHTAERRRLTVNEGKDADARRVFVFGGSTTYDAGVNDAGTWASQLSRRLGSGFTVENYGMDGFSSVETLVSTLFAFRDAKPACAVFYMGWNDLRSSHLSTLRPDYSDFHLPHQRGNLGLLPTLRIESYSVVARLVVSLARPPLPQPQGKVSSAYDPRLAAIYLANMDLIAAVVRHQGVKPIFVPQVIDHVRHATDGGYGWVPLIPYRDVPKVLDELNEDARRLTARLGAPFIDEPLSALWHAGDFVDDGHFNAEGARKFADALAGPIARHCGP